MDVLSAIETEIKDTMQSRGLLPYLLTEDSQFLNVGYFSIQIVLSDGNKIDEVASLVKQVRDQWEIEKGFAFEFLVRAKWYVSSVGGDEELWTLSNTFSAGFVVPATLKSGSRFCEVRVILTWESVETLRKLVSRPFQMVEVAEVAIEDLLRRGGTSAWDPLKEPTIQMNSAAALYTSRLMRRAA